MLIKSQNKKNLWNYDDLVRIYIKDENTRYSIRTLTNNGDEFLLGIYYKKENAQRVIDEIVKKYEMIEYGKYFGSPMIESSKNTFVYIMP